MTGRHYQWHRRWSVDPAAGTATHDSGLVARFLALPLTAAQERENDQAAAIGRCWAPDGREWGVVTTPAILESTFEALKLKHGPHNAQSMMARLAREAGEVWVYAIQEEER